MELIFEIRDAEEGGYCARALGHAIFTEGESWEELRANGTLHGILSEVAHLRSTTIESLAELL
jgi:hypothetical protein